MSNDVTVALLFEHKTKQKKKSENLSMTISQHRMTINYITRM